MSDQITATEPTQAPEGVEYKEAQVIAAGISYFTEEDALGPNGQPRKDQQGNVLKVTLRHEAIHADVVTMSSYEFDRLAALGMVREPSTAPLRGPLVATPFGIPVPRPDNPRELAAYEGPAMGDPRPTVGADPIELQRGRPGALSPEEAAHLERMAAGLEDANGNPVEDDEDVEDTHPEPGETPDYGSMSKEDLEALAEERELEIEGSGANGNIVKDDLVAALELDDEDEDEE